VARIRNLTVNGIQTDIFPFLASVYICPTVEGKKNLRSHFHLSLGSSKLYNYPCTSLPTAYLCIAEHLASLIFRFVLLTIYNCLVFSSCTGDAKCTSLCVCTGHLHLGCFHLLYNSFISVCFLSDSLPGVVPFTAHPNTNTSLYITWTPPISSTHPLLLRYEITITRNETNSYIVHRPPAGSYEFIAPGLIPGDLYTVSVIAVSLLGIGLPPAMEILVRTHNNRTFVCTCYNIYNGMYRFLLCHLRLAITRLWKVLRI